MYQQMTLEGPMAEGLMKGNVGDTVELKVKGKITRMEMREDMAVGMSGKGKKPKKGKTIPCVSLEIQSVNGKGGKPVEDMDNEEMEKEIAKAKGY